MGNAIETELMTKWKVIITAELWFQLEGATCHTAIETINLLKETFAEQIISRRRAVAWPSRSCDLTLFSEVMGSRCSTQISSRRLMTWESIIDALLWIKFYTFYFFLKITCLKKSPFIYLFFFASFFDTIFYWKLKVFNSKLNCV